MKLDGRSFDFMLAFLGTIYLRRPKRQNMFRFQLFRYLNHSSFKNCCLAIFNLRLQSVDVNCFCHSRVVSQFECDTDASYPIIFWDIKSMSTEWVCSGSVMLLACHLFLCGVFFAASHYMFDFISRNRWANTISYSSDLYLAFHFIAHLKLHLLSFLLISIKSRYWSYIDQRMSIFVMHLIEAEKANASN